MLEFYSIPLEVGDIGGESWKSVEFLKLPLYIIVGISQQIIENPRWLTVVFNFHHLYLRVQMEFFSGIKFQHVW